MVSDRKERNEQILSFYIPASGVDAHSVARVEVPEWAEFLELVVISGGPVFMFRGRVDEVEAFRRTNVPAAIDFDLAASGTAKGSIGLTRGGYFTVSSGNETIGFVRCTQGKP